MFSRKKSADGIATTVRGFLRLEAQKISGIPINSPEHDQFLQSMSHTVKAIIHTIGTGPDTDPAKQQFKQLALYLDSLPGDATESLLGEASVLLTLRIGFANQARIEGAITKEEAEPSAILAVIHKQIRSIVEAHG